MNRKYSPLSHYYVKASGGPEILFRSSQRLLLFSISCNFNCFAKNIPGRVIHTQTFVSHFEKGLYSTRKRQIVLSFSNISMAAASSEGFDQRVGIYRRAFHAMHCNSSRNSPLASMRSIVVSIKV